MANDVFANARDLVQIGRRQVHLCLPRRLLHAPRKPGDTTGCPHPLSQHRIATDTTGGSKTVKISKEGDHAQEQVLLQEKHRRRSRLCGEERCPTSTNRGKVYFTTWSMDVKTEGANVVSHLDITTHNHMCGPGNTPPWMHVDAMAFGDIADCAGDKKKIQEACDKFTPRDA